MLHEQMHFSRYSMYRAIETWVESRRGMFKGQVGKTVGGKSPLTTLLPEMTWEVTDYPKVDVMALPWQDGSVSVLIADQMLEHVKQPWKAAAEMSRVLCPGGVLICTTCFMQRWHPPAVYFSFHMDGLKVLFQEMFSELTVGGWGNAWSNQRINFNDWWRHQKVTGNEALLHFADINDEKAPLVTWALGVK